MLHSITINGEELPILVRKHRASRRFVIRYQPLAHALSLTLPRYASIRQGLRFVEEKRGWIEREINARPAFIPLMDGQRIPVLGKPVTIERREGRGVTRIEGERLLVHGAPEFIARRVREFLKRMIKDEITKLAGEKAAYLSSCELHSDCAGSPSMARDPVPRSRSHRMTIKIKKISLRDTSSRWGSCSHEGNLSFSWRLVFAPYGVLDYLVCHEVAHIKEHNHGDAFWALVETLCPDWRVHERWLKKHGGELYRYK